jgi:repressor of nif and glnA expression
VFETTQTQQSVRFVQQILAHDSNVLSVEELSYRNPDIESATVDYHLRKLESAGLTERLSADDPANDLPDTYWTVTERGVARLDELGFYDEIEALVVADEMLERTERIERIEIFDGRPRIDVPN